MTRFGKKKKKVLLLLPIVIIFLTKDSNISTMFLFQLCAFGGKEEKQGYQAMLESFSKDGVSCLEAATGSTSLCAQNRNQKASFFSFYSHYYFL